MPEEVLIAAYRNSIHGRPSKLDAPQNAMMGEFMREMMSEVNASSISSMECYHSCAWESESIIEIVANNPRVELWSVHAPYGKYIDPSAPDDEARQGAVSAYTDAVRTAARIGAGVVVAHPGANVEYSVSKKERLKISAETIGQVTALAGELGVAIAVEPLPKQEPGNSLDEVLEIVSMVDLPNVGINFDVNHLFPPEDVPSLIRRAGKLIRSVHISDQDGQERHWLPFEGTLDWTAVLGALVEVGYAGPLIYETHIRDANTCAAVVSRVEENYGRLIDCVR